MSPIYTGDKFGFGASTSAGGGGGGDVYNNAGIVFTNAGAYGSAGPSSQNITNEYKDQKFYTENHYFYYSSANNPGGFIFVKTPQTGTYTFEIRGAFGGPSDDWSGGTNKGGSPWYLKGEVDLVGGRWIGVVVGQRGGEAGKDYGGSTGGGGGGGTFLFELDGSESETSISNSYIESASVTCLLVAAGGNGANWSSWNSQDTPARDETGTGATDWILGSINSGNSWGQNIFGRGGFGGSFNYTPYSTVDATPGDAQNPMYRDYPGRPRISGNPLLDVNGKIHEYSLWGGVQWIANADRYRDKNYDPNQSNQTGAFGGFGGGGGTQYEGGGGGGYWGGAAWQENQYSTIYNYGAQSYVHPTRVTVKSSRIYGDGVSGYGDTLAGLDMNCRARRQRDNGPPLRELHGKLYLCPKKSKSTAIGEAVFHADGLNIGDTRNGVGKVTKYDWYVPEGVTSISTVCVGGGGSGMGRHDGGSGGGGALSYKNNITVEPGQKIVVQVGCGGFFRNYDSTDRSPKGTDSKITVYPMPTGGTNNGGSVYLNGSSVIKLGADSSNSPFDIPSNTGFCMEAWVYLTNMSSYNNIMSAWDSSCGYHGILWHINSSGQIFFGGFGGNTYTSNSGVTANNWHHVAVASNGNSVEFYIDGVMKGGFNNNSHNENNSCGMFVGANMDGSADGSGGSYRMNGYISNLRYVVGHKTYDSSFTPPTEPLTPTSQNVPAGACRFLGFQDSTEFDVSPSSMGVNADYGTPTASGLNPFGANSPSGTVYALAGGGYGVYASGQSCASSQNDIDKGRGGISDSNTSDGGGDGGNGMQYSGCRQGGGGAGGYGGGGLTTSGYPSNHQYSGCSGSGGNNGGGGGGAGANGTSDYYAGGGGGTGIYGAGVSGQKGDLNQNGNPDSQQDFAGKGGSPAHYTGTDGYTNREPGNHNADGTKGGLTGYNRHRPNYWTAVSGTNYKAGDGGFPGGGGSGGNSGDIWGAGGAGAVRIIWGQVSGSNRAFGNPSTNADISTTYDSDADVFRIGTQPQY